MSASSSRPQSPQSRTGDSLNGDTLRAQSIKTNPAPYPVKDPTISQDDLSLKGYQSRKPRWTRMGKAIRRSSSFSIRRRTPSRASDSEGDAVSAKSVRSNFAPTKSVIETVRAPRPNAESLPREVVNGSKPPSPVPISLIEPDEETTAQPDSTSAQDSPVVPQQPMGSSVTGPVAFTDDMDDLPVSLPLPTLIDPMRLGNSDNGRLASTGERATTPVRELDPEQSADDNDVLATHSSAQSLSIIDPFADQPGDAAVLIPLPHPDTVLSKRSTHASGSTTASRHKGTSFETDETRPLLSNASKGKSKPYLLFQAEDDARVYHSSQTRSALWPIPYVGNLPLHQSGWLEYLLPDGTLYFFHPLKRITTDADLRDESKLVSVMYYLDTEYEAANGSALWAQHLEVWLRGDLKGHKTYKTVFARYIVDHERRSVVLDVTGDIAKADRSAIDDDAHLCVFYSAINVNVVIPELDMEYRYWSFMEAHPAHVHLPANAATEAMDALTLCHRGWSGTISNPFSQEECKELMLLLQSSDPSNADIQSVFRIRVVARILLRLIRLKQQRLRPNKPLPKDVCSSDLSAPRKSWSSHRVLFGSMSSCLCRGAHRHRRMDEESQASMHPMVQMPGSSLRTCLTAIVVLGASSSLLLLPGLDHLSRSLGLVAVHLSCVSVVMTVVATFIYKVDLRNHMVTSEGHITIPRRSIVVTLSISFLLSSIILLVAAIIAFSFRVLSAN